MPLEAPVTLNGVSEQREHSLLQRLLSAQAFWVTVALLIMCAVMSVLQPAGVRQQRELLQHHA